MTTEERRNAFVRECREYRRVTPNLSLTDAGKLAHKRLMATNADYRERYLADKREFVRAKSVVSVG